MSYADTDRKVLLGFTEAVRGWTDIFLADTANQTLDLSTTLLEDDMMDLRRVRWYSIHTEPELEKLWLRYVDRENEEGEKKNSLFDYVMTGSTYMLLHNPVTDTEFSSFIRHLARTLSWPSRAVAIPADIRGYLGGAEEFTSALETNHWLIFLILLSMIKIEQ